MNKVHLNRYPEPGAPGIRKKYAKHYGVDDNMIMDGIKPYPSKANFIFFSCDLGTDSVYRKLIQEGVLIKNLNSPGVLGNCMRVAVGTGEENEEFVKALKKVLLKLGA